MLSLMDAINGRPYQLIPTYVDFHLTQIQLPRWSFVEMYLPMYLRNT
jgi:hypothetical protein